MPVAAEEELRNHLDAGWKLYFHNGVRRWYVYRGARDRKIVSARLEDLCNRIYKALKGEKEPIPALEIQESRLQGQPIKDIASDMGISRGAVYNALDKKPNDVIKPRERLQEGVLEATPSREIVEAKSSDEERVDDNLLSPLIIGGLLVGVPLSILALWFFGNLAAGN